MVATGDAWAVGDKYGNDGYLHPWIRRWDGTKWRLVLKPDRFSGDLSDVEAISRDDVWAMADHLVHWDGSEWSHVSLPANGDPYRLEATSMRTATDGWLVGSAEVDGHPVPVSFHWDGRQWNRILAKGFPRNRTFTAVTALTSDDAWAAGQAPGFRADSTIVAHWNGNRWQPIDAPELRPAAVTELAAVADDDIWMTG